MVQNCQAETQAKMLYATRREYDILYGCWIPTETFARKLDSQAANIDVLHR